jgi:hypothetical protein
MQAITFTAPVHSLQVLMSILKTRLRRFAQVIDTRRSAGDGRSSTTLALLPLANFRRNSAVRLILPNTHHRPTRFIPAPVTR